MSGPPARQVSLLEVSGVAKHFGGLTALAGVDITVEAGEIVGLIGPNGSGKTTLFHCIAGALMPDDGDIRLHGQSLLGVGPHVVCARGVGRTFQLVRVFPQLSALDNVLAGQSHRAESVMGAFAGASTSAVRRRALGLLEFMGLADHASISASDGRFDVLRGLSLRVARGELVAVLGPNGAGKSTLLKTVAGFLRPRQGSIQLEGEEIGGLRPPALLRKGIAYVMQRSSLFPKMTIQENLELGAYVRETTDEVRTDIERVLALFPRLAERRRQRAEGLSGGERRMLEIGRGLLLRPRLLLLDEPTMGLAPLVMDLIFDKILEVRATGTTVVMVEQNARRALEVSDRAYVLEQGQTRVEGRGEELLRSEAVRRAYLGSGTAGR